MAERPNIILFMPDQLRADALGCSGNALAKTPHIDALAARGTRFTQAYSQHSVCSPSRASMLTGWYPHTMGHRTLTHLLKPWEPNVLRMLKDSGYTIAWPGARGDTFAQGVLEDSVAVAGYSVRPTTMYKKPDTPDDHPMTLAFYTGKRAGDGVTLDFDEATVRTAEEWLATNPPEPWLLFVALIFPHPPFECEEPWFSMHDRASMPLPVPPADGKPRFQQAIRERYRTGELSEDDWREVAATYYGMVSRVDDHLGRIEAAVERTGAAERTTTLFFTDHGEYLGDYGLVEKWPSGLDDCLLRNPLIVAGSGVAEGATCDALVEMVDLTPTLLGMAGVEARHTHFGRDLATLLRDANAPHRDAVFSEGGFLVEEEPLLERSGPPYHLKQALQHEDPALVGKAASIRTLEWTYIYRLEERDELYSRIDDPREERNLIDAPEHAAVAIELRERILRWMIETSDVIPWESDKRFDMDLGRGLKRGNPRRTQGDTT